MRLAGGALFTGALVYLVSIFLGYRESAKEYASLEQVVFEQDAEEPAVETENTKQQPVSADEKESLSQEDRKILQNIASLHEENEDVIGWIRFDTLDISYPIMQCMDNEYYLNHTFSGEENAAGSIFMEAANTSAFEDSHTIIYGHNMKNGSMFGSLKNYKTKDFYGGNEYFKIYTLESVYRYQIFAYYDISMYGDVYNIQYGPDESFGQFIDNMVKRSYYDTGVRPEYTDKILTLSTCSTEGNRFVVNAVRISN